MPTSSTRTAVAPVFDTYRLDLDNHNDRRERLIKASRDITNLSKKVIFLLHRAMSDSGSRRDENNDESVRRMHAAACGRDKLQEIKKLFAGIAEEVQGDCFWRYQRNVSPGLQEYIEALSFTHYLETGKLVSYEQVQQTLADDAGQFYFPLPLEDYLLGLSDLTGELMRYAISTISQRGGRSNASEVCTFVRNCKSDFETLTPHFRELQKKQRVTQQSLEKIEDATYAIAVRSSEYDLPLDLLDDIVARTVSGMEVGGRRRFPDGGDEEEFGY